MSEKAHHEFIRPVKLKEAHFVSPTTFTLSLINDKYVHSERNNRDSVVIVYLWKEKRGTAEAPDYYYRVFGGSFDKERSLTRPVKKLSTAIDTYNNYVEVWLKDYPNHVLTYMMDKIDPRNNYKRPSDEWKRRDDEMKAYSKNEELMRRDAKEHDLMKQKYKDVEDIIMRNKLGDFWKLPEAERDRLQKLRENLGIAMRDNMHRRTFGAYPNPKFYPTLN